MKERVRMPMSSAVCARCWTPGPMPAVLPGQSKRLTCRSTFMRRVYTKELRRTSRSDDAPVALSGKNVSMSGVTRPLSTSLAVAAAASAGAGLVHAAAAGSHRDDATLAWLLAICAVAQLGWAVAVVLRPQRLVVVAGLGLNAGCVAVWALTHTVGLGGPFGSTEAIGL